MLFVSTKHIAYFLSSFFCLFSLFPYLYVGVPWPWAINYRWAIMEIHEDTGSWEHPFYLFIFSCHFISCCNMTLVYQLSFGHLYWSYVLTMEVFTISWWVVNQSIVAIIFLYASTGWKLSYPTLGGVKLLILHIVGSIVSYLWWGDSFKFIFLLLYLLLSYSWA